MSADSAIFLFLSNQNSYINSLIYIAIRIARDVKKNVHIKRKNVKKRKNVTKTFVNVE